MTSTSTDATLNTEHVVPEGILYAVTWDGLKQEAKELDVNTIYKCGYWSGTHEALQSRYGSCSIKKIELHDFGTCLHPKGTESLWFKQPNMVENNLKTVLNKKFDDDVEHGFAPGVEMFILDVDTLREQAEKAINLMSKNME